MRRAALLICAICFISMAKAQNDKELMRLSYWRYGLFYENATDDKGNELGATAGFELSVNPTYGGQDAEDNFNLGWSLNLLMGWNFEEQNLGPYRLDIGIWGGYLLGDNMEIGAQYCFLGAYAYQNRSFFGSSLNPAFRLGQLQLTWYRAGEGVFYGWLIPKNADQGSTSNGIELTWAIANAIVLGGRFNTYVFGETRTDEIRISVCLNLGEVYKSKYRRH